MSFDTIEESALAGDPVECYLFEQGEKSWRWTSADADITLPDWGIFLQETISRDEIKHSQEDWSGACQVYLPRTNELAALFIPGGAPVTPVRLRILCCHRGDEGNPIVVFAGRVVGASFAESQAALPCETLSLSLKDSQPGMVVSLQCPLVLFGPGCNVEQASFSDTVTIDSISGRDVTAAAFASRADGWYTAGKLIHPAGGRAFVVDHVGDTITLSAAMTDLAAGDVVTATAGCDGTEATCAAKFDNRINCLAFSRLPLSNPFLRTFKR